MLEKEINNLETEVEDRLQMNLSQLKLFVTSQLDKYIHELTFVESLSY